MDHCEKCMKAAKDAGAGEEPEADGEKNAPQGDLIKAAVEAALAPLKTEVAALTEKLAKTAAPGQQIPLSGAPVLVQKSTPTPFDELVEAPAVTH